MEAADFSGYATKANLKCSDGRTITPEAFKHMDGMSVPLVWQHGHSSPENVLGHVMLEARADGMYCHAFFNNSPWGQGAKAIVEHGDIKHLSIFANELVEKVVGKAKQVLHGMIREVSLVLAAANPGALIDQVRIQHGDDPTDFETLDDAAIIHTGLEIELVHASGDDETVQDVYESLTEKQQGVVNYLIGLALESTGATVAQSALTESNSTEGTGEGTGSEEKNDVEDDTLAHQEGSTVTHRNVFDRTTDDAPKSKGERIYVNETDLKSILHDAMRGGSLKTAVESYALKHGITDIDLLFPDAQLINNQPEWDKRRTEWVAGVINGTHKTPFSRIKTMVADLTFEQARARGYVKGSLKKEEYFGLTKRTTGPTTVYKKQKLDRDDVLDIKDLDVVAWLKGEMRLMLEEEIARAILIGDGRAVDDPDKIKDPVGAQDGNGIRSILNDDDLYAASVFVNIDDASSSYQEMIDAIVRARRLYKGTGTPDFYTTELVISNLLLLKDTTGRKLYSSIEELATTLRVGRIIAVEVMEDESTCLGIIVNLVDYNVGTDRGGEVSMFDDFDLDYNQLKYLIETRLSGALVKIRSALIIKKVASTAALVVPVSPTQDEDEVTVATTTGVTYKVGSFSGTVTYNGSPVTADLTVTASFPIVLADGASVTVYAVPSNSSNYYFANNVDDEWAFSYEA